MLEFENYLGELVKSTLEDKKPKDLPVGVTVEDILRYAEINHMEYILMNGLTKLKIDREQKARIQERLKRKTFISGVQIYEYEKLHQAFEENGIVNQPMKGILLKKIYPNAFMREMGDIDLLVEEECNLRMEGILNRLGFQLEKKVHHHDVYHKGPYLIVEVHSARYDKTVDRNQYEYFKDFSKALKDKDCEYTYQFTQEDFYVYMIAHMAKHFYQMGCGIRNLVDIYVFRNYYRGKLDEEYIDSELKKCGIYVFAKHMEKLVRIWLMNEESDLFYDNLFSYMLNCGIYGKDENGIWNEFAKQQDESVKTYNARLRHFYRFPPYRYMVKYHPWISGKKFLLPFAWVGRLIFITISGKGDKKLNMLNEISDQDVRIIQEIYSKMQFDFQA